MFTFAQCGSITNGEILANNNPGNIEHFLIDSRRMYHARASAFVAIEGVRHDGHDYLEEVYNLGVRKFILEKEYTLPDWIRENSSVLLVERSIAALQKLAIFHRNKFDWPIIGITGSNGKTIIKEWLGELLGERYNVVKSPKSYNSQLGVPLSIFMMQERNNLGVFEAGISTTGEMTRLKKIIQPTLGIFSNIGSAHDEGFTDRREKAREKWQLFVDCDKVIYCSDHELIDKTKPKTIEAFTWGRATDSDVEIQRIQYAGHQTELNLIFKGKNIDLKIPLYHQASTENAMHCISMMIFLGYSVSEISDSLGNLSDVDMRLSLKKGINNCYLIDDSYNNDLGGLQTAIDFLKNQPTGKKRIILSDILQSGLDEKVLYQQVSQVLNENDIDSMIGIGEALTRNSAIFSIESAFYNSTERFLNSFNTDEFIDETILIKGARSFEFERITNTLAEKIHGTVLEINLDALNHNLNYYRSKLGNSVKLMVMVKAAAYGNGSFEIANLLEFNRVDYLSVAYVDEGVELRKHGITLPVMVMNVVEESFDNIIKYNLEPEIYSLGQLKDLIRFVKHRDIHIKIHIKIDSGMHRLGFEADQIDELISVLSHTSRIEIVSIYSHLAGADEERHNDFSNDQVLQFLEVAQKIDSTLQVRTLKHILNSAGIIRFPEYQLDMVRLGIGLYGFEANQLVQNDLRPISTLKTVILQIRYVKQGDTIGYGRKGVVTKDAKIATIAIGYADGFLRAFGNGKISLMVHGKTAPVIGNICMDMCMLDITGIDAKEGDEVVVFGDNPTIKQFADAIGTIPYEILTNISNRVNRVFYTN